MSKRNNHRGGYSAAKSNTGIKLVAVLALVLAVAYVITALALGMQWNPINWFKRSAAQGTGATNNGVLNVIESNGIDVTAEQLPRERYAAYSLSDDTENAYIVTATVEPEKALDKRILAYTQWKNASSEFAQGKRASDFISTKVIDDTNQVVMACAAAFGEPIYLKIAAYTDSEVNCTVQLDYVKHLVDVKINLNQVDLEGAPILSGMQTPVSLYVTPKYNTALTFNPNVNKVTVTPVYGVGTVEGKTDVKTTITLAEKMKNQLDADLDAGGSATASLFCRDTVTFEGATFSVPFSSLLDGGGSTTSMEIIVNNYFCKWGTSNGGGIGSGFESLSGISFEVTYTYGAFNQTVTKSSNGAKICSDGLEKVQQVTNITPDKDNVVFY